MNGTKKTGLLCASLLALVVGCQTVSDVLGKDDNPMVVTSPDFVADGATPIALPVSELPEDLLAKLPEGLQGTDIVVVNKDELVAVDSPHVPVSVDTDAWLTEGALAGVLSSILAILTGFFPGLAAWELLLAGLFKRKRTHWLNAIKNLVPWANGDAGELAVADALKDAAKALGAEHSSDATKEVFELGVDSLEDIGEEEEE
jgi:hypothetical protein